MECWAYATTHPDKNSVVFDILYFQQCFEGLTVKTLMWSVNYDIICQTL